MSVVHGPKSPLSTDEVRKRKAEQPRFDSNPDPGSRGADDVRGCTSKWEVSFNCSDVARQSAGWQSNRDSTYPFIMPLGASPIPKASPV
jgi:hypothetical protein